MKSSESIRISKEELDSKLSNVIMRQTNYSKDEAIKKLKEYNYNVKKILLDYYKIETKKENASSTRYDLIRNFLDKR